MEMIRISKLVIDMATYPRMKINWDNVQRLVSAMEAGCELPAIVYCTRTLRVADGVHRVKAVERLNGGGGEIAAVGKDYASDADFFLDCIRFNAEHGEPLGDGDRMRITELARSLNIDPARIAKSLRMTVASTGQLTVAPRSKPADVKRTTISVKPRYRAPVMPLDEPPDPEPSVNAPPEEPPPFAFIAAIDCVIRSLQDDAFDAKNTQVANKLKKLAELIDEAGVLEKLVQE